MDSISIGDELSAIRARARLLELALLGADKSGMSLEDPTYLDALTQQASDVAHQLEELGKRIGGPSA